MYLSIGVKWRESYVPVTRCKVEEVMYLLLGVKWRKLCTSH